MGAVLSSLNHDHDLRFVVAAAVLCVATVAFALRVFQHADACSPRDRIVWSIVGALIFSTGIWSTHFVAMLGFDPGAPRQYALGPTLVSAIMLAPFGLAGAWAYRSAWWARMAGGAAVGLGITLMHFVGMKGFMHDAMVAWRVDLVVWAIAIATCLGALAGLAAPRAPFATRELWRPLVLLSCAVCGLHFTAMSAWNVAPSALASAAAGPGDMLIAALICAVGIGVVVLACAAFLFEMRDSLRRESDRAELTRIIRRLKASEAELRRARDLSELAIRASGVGLYYRDVKDGSDAVWSDELYAMFGYEPGEIASGIDTFNMLVHPDDREQVVARRRAQIEDHSSQPIEFRMAHKSGEYRWVRGTMHAEWGADGKVTRVYGAIMDVHDLRVARDEAQAADRLKSQFLANMSHEFRTPMNGIVGMAAMLATTELDDRQRDMLDVVRTSGEMLMDLVTCVLDLAALEAGELKAKRRPFEPRDVVDAVERVHSVAARAKGVEIVVAFGEAGHARRVGDPARLEQIVSSLVSNAVKFTHSGRVLISVHGSAEEIVIDISDSGKGMTEEERARVFDLFSQADSSHTRRHDGAGLGLTLVKRLVDMLAGSVDVESAPSVGTTVSVHVPFPLVEAEGAPVEGEMENLEQGSESSARPLRILCVEDNDTNRNVLGALLEPVGAEVAFAENGQIATEMFKPGAFDVVLMDIHMPVMNGEIAFGEMRAAEANATRRTPIYAVTADVMPERLIHYAKLGFDGCVPKPIKPDVLYAAISEAIEANEGSQAEPKLSDALKPA